MKDRTHSVDSLGFSNKGAVVPTGERIQRLRGDLGTELTNADARQYYLDTGITLEFASQTTPQQIGANERAGRTIVNIVRCADSGLPKFLWGELMPTAVFPSNRSPRAALNSGTPCKALYGEDAHLGHLRVIGSRAFVHHETYTKAGAPRLGRTSCRIQHGQQVVSGLQRRNGTCAGESKRYLHRDAFRHASAGCWWLR